MADVFKIHQREVSQEDFKALRGRLESFGGSVEELAVDKEFSLKEITGKIDRFTGGNGRFELSDIAKLRVKIGPGAFTDFLDFLGSHHVNLYREAVDLPEMLLSGRLAAIPEPFWEDRAFVVAGIPYSAAAYCHAAPDIQFDFEIAGLASALDSTTLQCMPNSVGLAIGKMAVSPKKPISALKVLEPNVREPLTEGKPKSPTPVRKSSPPAVVIKESVAKAPPTFPTPH